MNFQKQLILITSVALSLSTQAAELVTRLDGAIEHRCSVTISNSEKSVTYKDFSSAVNSFKSLHGSIPASQRYRNDGNSTNRLITLNTRSSIRTIGNTYSNCMSLTLANSPVFAQASDVEKYLLNTEGGFVDVCWSSYDGSVGLSRTVTKIGTDSTGKDLITESSDHPLRQLPGLEINLAKRTLIAEGSSQRLSLNPTDYVTQRGSLVIEGDGSITRKIGDLTVEVNCLTQEKSF
jgi:hypothetical protein